MPLANLTTRATLWGSQVNFYQLNKNRATLHQAKYHQWKTPTTRTTTAEWSIRRAVSTWVWLQAERLSVVIRISHLHNRLIKQEFKTLNLSNKSELVTITTCLHHPKRTRCRVPKKVMSILQVPRLQLIRWWGINRICSNRFSRNKIRQRTLMINRI